MPPDSNFTQSRNRRNTVTSFHSRAIAIATIGGIDCTTTLDLEWAQIFLLLLLLREQKRENVHGHHSPHSPRVQIAAGGEMGKERVVCVQCLVTAKQIQWRKHSPIVVGDVPAPLSRLSPEWNLVKPRAICMCVWARVRVRVFSRWVYVWVNVMRAIVGGRLFWLPHSESKRRGE